MKWLLSVFCFLLSIPACAATFAAVHPDAVRWRSNTVSLGESSADTTNHFFAVNAMSRELTVSGSYPNKFYWLNPRAGDALGAALVNLKYPGVLGEETNVNLDAGDYVPSGGLSGNGTDEYVQTGINPRSIGISTNSVGLWISVNTTQAMGTSRALVSHSDGGNNFSLALGVFAGGTKSMGVIGTPTTGVAEYVEGVSNSLTGFLGVHVRSHPVQAPSASVASTNAGSVPLVSPTLQGIAHDGTHGYLMWSQRIVKYQLSDNVPVLTNDLPFLNAIPTNFNHVGDGCVYNGKLITVIEGYSSVSTLGSNACIAEYSLTDLSLGTVKSITNINPSAGGCVVGGGVLWVISGAQDYHDRIWKFDPDTYEYLGYLQTQLWFPVIQGIEYTNGFLIVSEGGSDSPDNANYYSINTTNGAVDMFMWQAAGITEAEGLMIHGTNMVAANSVSGTWKLQWFPLLTYTTNAWHGQHFFADGVMTNRCAIGTKGFANNQLYVLASDANGSPGSLNTRRVGLTALTQGLEREQIETFNRAVYRFDRFLGRR